MILEDMLKFFKFLGGILGKIHLVMVIVNMITPTLSIIQLWQHIHQKPEALSVVIPSALTAVSNMPAASETTLERQKRRRA